VSCKRETREGFSEKARKLEAPIFLKILLNIHFSGKWGESKIFFGKNEFSDCLLFLLVGDFCHLAV
jgi:hypothetical protein